MSQKKQQQTADDSAQETIGWNGRTLAQMLHDSQEVYARTGHYYGTERLTIKESDPIYYEKIWSRLRGTLVGARETALNISGSPIVREIGELCFGLYTPEGDSVAISTGIMAHIHTMSDAIKHMVASDYEYNPGIADGDIFVNNDPQLGDVHNADVQEFIPIIYEGEILGWCAGVTHEIDVGAPIPSGVPVGITSRFEDGWILSCEKVGSKDRLHTDYEYRAQTATRMPFYWVLDEKCRIAGCQLIRDAAIRLIEEIGVETYKTFIREVIEETRRSFLQTVKTTLVPGKYTFAGFTDLTYGADKGKMPDHAAIDTLQNSPIEVIVAADGRLLLDLDGANKWGYHCFNSTPTAIQAGLWIALTQTVIPNDKVNDGAYLATQTRIPPGTWADPQNPHCSNSLSWLSFMAAITGLLKAISTGFAARGFVEEVISSFAWTGNATQGGGINQYGQDASWTNFEMSCSGVSAGYVKDGENTCAAIWNPEGDMGDVEAWELMEPLLYLGRRLRPSTAGMGKYRGGSGFESTRMLHGTEKQQLFNIANGHVFFGGGMFGGYPAGTQCRHQISETDMKQRIENQQPYPICVRDSDSDSLAGLITGNVLLDQNVKNMPTTRDEYDLYFSTITGGHGLGDVLDRDPAMVIEDLNEDLLLPRFAESTYGVVAEQDAQGLWHADLEKTTLRRQQIRDLRLQRSILVADWYEPEKQRVEAMDYSETLRRMYHESLTLSTSWASSFRMFWDLDSDWDVPKN